ncbi:MAG: cysteine hydrolase [Eubacteriales bacterium]|nr:cysteine hydrolase [Eubacteriales bacterium]
MSKEVLVVVDMQNDFLTGCLGNGETAACVPAVVARIQRAQAQGAVVVLTRDTHGADYLQTHEGRLLPVIHCVQGTPGWQICPQVEQAARGCRVFDKGQFGSPELMDFLKDRQPGSVEFIGVCTDICVISNAVMARSALPEAQIRVYAPACAGVTPQSNKNALAAMRACHIEVEA